MVLYAATIFTSAFLLFAVQPVIAKAILPWFGGTAAVWTTCLLFFQTVLLGGYVYAHWTIRRLPGRAQAILHIALLVACLALLPVGPGTRWKPAGNEDPIPRILALLATSVGLPYFLLSATGPLVQAWFARTTQGALPYRLYALSNLGSMLALLGYPVAIEPLLSIRNQLRLWSGGFAVFVILCAAVAWRARASKAAEETAGPDTVVSPKDRALWLLLAAVPSLLLLAVTNHLCQNVAAIPFLWVLPLALYLLTFILCF
ncbi:MAG: hypothetical protein ACRD96_13245, partial [Bryobacteraceae bacterium]